MKVVNLFPPKEPEPPKAMPRFSVEEQGGRYFILDGQHPDMKVGDERVLHTTSAVFARDACSHLNQKKATPTEAT